ncbi:hypothetical protein TvY486_0027450 [Trypanosoma vivax Y486]|uniref:Uncharacterized protein n=1 Tax=Trypanosoma vivax (strain Y486) TaxID=1055687 RepID=F9WR06_TRYVY|nr:hypothetical protein TvY486_0027450 [Trypanosoma vivax Y486]|eukprot:CCD19989.1 hypothetical protein TvY486_0027450 [Trypanosoma vivax Y486]
MRLFQCFAFALICSLLYQWTLVSRASARFDVATLPVVDATKLWLCEWWRSKALVEQSCLHVRVNLLRVYRELNDGYRSCVKEVSDSGPTEQYADVAKRQLEVNAKFYDLRLTVDEAGRYTSSITAYLWSWQNHFISESYIRQSCATFSPVAEPSPLRNITFLYDELEKAVNTLFDLSKQKAVLHHDVYESKLILLLKLLKKTNGIDRLSVQVREGFNSVKQALRKTRTLKNSAEVKIAISCAFENRLNIMKDTFLALGAAANDVIAWEAYLSSRATAVRSEAIKLGMGATVLNKRPVGNMARDAMVEASEALRKVLDVMYGGASRNLQLMLSRGTEFKYNFSQCASGTRPERDLLLRLVADQQKSRLDNFEVWREMTENLWENVVNVMDHVHVDCDSFEEVNCAAVLAQLNKLMEVSRQSRESVVAKLGSTVKVLNAIWETLIREKIVFDDKLVEKSSISWVSTLTKQVLDNKNVEGRPASKYVERTVKSEVKRDLRVLRVNKSRDSTESKHPVPKEIGSPGQVTQALHHHKPSRVDNGASPHRIASTVGLKAIHLKSGTDAVSKVQREKHSTTKYLATVTVFAITTMIIWFTLRRRRQTSGYVHTF